MVGTNHTFPLQLSESRPQCVTTHLERLAKCTFTRQPVAPVALLDLVAEYGRGLADQRLSPRDRIHGCHGLKTGVRRWGGNVVGPLPNVNHRAISPLSNAGNARPRTASIPMQRGLSWPGRPSVHGRLRTSELSAGSAQSRQGPLRKPPISAMHRARRGCRSPTRG